MHQPLISMLLATTFFFVPLRTTAQDKDKDADGLLEKFAIRPAGEPLLVPITFKDKQYQFVLDTGATATVFDVSLPLGPMKGKIKADSAGGPVEVAIFGGQEYQLGKLKIDTGEFSVGVDLTKVREVSGQPIYGMVGMDFLVKHVVHIDFDAGVLQILKTVPAGAGEPWALDITDMRPAFRAKLQGKRDVQFLIDTGSVGFGTGDLKKELLADLEKETGGFRTVGETLSETLKGTASNRLVQGKSLSLGQFTLANPVFSESKWNNVGLCFLSRFKVTFDFPGRKLYLAKGKRFDEPDIWDLSGLHLVRKEGRTVAHSVDKGSPAAAGGVKAGDALSEVAGKKADAMSLFELRRLFCQSGSKLRLVLQRQEQTVETSVVLREAKK